MLQCSGFMFCEVMNINVYLNLLGCVVLCCMCFDIVCDDMICYVVLRCDMIWYAMLFYAVVWHGMSCCIELYHVV